MRRRAADDDRAQDVNGTAAGRTSWQCHQAGEAATLALAAKACVRTRAGERVAQHGDQPMATLWTRESAAARMARDGACVQLLVRLLGE